MSRSVSRPMSRLYPTSERYSSSSGWAMVTGIGASSSKISTALRRMWLQTKVTNIVFGVFLGVTATYSMAFLPRLDGKQSHTRGARGTELLEPPILGQVEAAWGLVEDLIIVAGHSTFAGANFEDADEESSAWILYNYQKRQLPAFLNHLKTGVELAAKNKKALLVFSGGETRLQGGPRSEAQSYWWTADAHKWFGHGHVARDRSVTEEFARDSFENLLFSVCRFFEVAGRYPSTITVVSFKFKEERFTKLHRKAIRWPSQNFYYVGVDVNSNPMPAYVFDAEQKNSIQYFEKDPFGCMGPLAVKRAKRNPFKRQIPYPKGCPLIEELFTYCGSTPFNKDLPWTTATPRPSNFTLRV